jgi:serine/threonine protein kinase
MTLTSGTNLGPREILPPLGPGGMGEVYRALNPGLARDVAVKALPELFATRAGRFRRFKQQEARAVGALNCPNTLFVHCIDAQSGVQHIVTELLERETPREKLSSGARLPRAWIRSAGERLNKS